MDTVKKIKLIETTLLRRGDGKSFDSPIRVITQFWTPDGSLVAEKDPAALIVTSETILEVREALFEKLGENDKGREIADLVIATLRERSRVNT